MSGSHESKRAQGDIYSLVGIKLTCMQRTGGVGGLPADSHAQAGRTAFG